MTTLLKTGELFRIKGTNCNSHNYLSGRTYRALRDDNGGGVCGVDIESGFTGNTITSTNYERVDFTKEEIQTAVEKLEKEIAEKKSMLQWMNEVGVEKYDELEHKCWQCINKLDEKSTAIEKAKAIAKLIRK